MSLKCCMEYTIAPENLYSAFFCRNYVKYYFQADCPTAGADPDLWKGGGQNELRH